MTSCPASPATRRHSVLAEIVGSEEGGADYAWLLATPSSTRFGQSDHVPVASR
jgi:hypothetical protein